ncbi:MAG: virulence protein RhuM/Fic/DOC family protein [Bacilli bacterium]|nr:virulence protein RhuM/Fic/DOC family protein [Bacilli bacterium]
MKNEIILFENQGVKLEVNMKDETVWLSQTQMAKLFEKDRKTITRHIQNIYKDGELEQKTVCSFFEHTGADGKKYKVQFYNLDMIISVGYRVNSKQGIVFRKWATNVLKDYMLKGYAVNQKRLDYLEKTIKLVNIAGRIDYELSGKEALDIIKVINTYSNALDLLDDYDHKKVVKPKGTNSNNQIKYEDCINIIEKLKFNNESSLFALERNSGLKSIIENIYQSFNGKELYPTIEEKAANLLYFIVKDHVFIDGNKRIAATLFIYFLDSYDILYKDNQKVIDNNTLVAITLLVAQSDPKEKEILVDLITNFLISN